MPSIPKSDLIDNDVLEPKEPPIKSVGLKKIAQNSNNKESIKIVKVKSAHKLQESKSFTSKKSFNSKSVSTLKPKSKQAVTDEDVNASIKKISMQSSLYQKLNMSINYESAKNAKLRILKPVESNSILVKPVKNLNRNKLVIAVPNEKSQIWNIDIDDKVISVTLNKWAFREGYTLIWDSKTDFQIQTSGVIRGTFKSAINEVLRSFKDTDSPLKANWYKNKVIRIISLDAVGLKDK